MSAKPFVLKALEMEAAEAPRGEAPPAAAALVSAQLSLYHNDFGGAAAELEAACAASPKELEGWCLLGEAKLRGGDAAAAREAYGKALSLAPTKVAAGPLLCAAGLALAASEPLKAKELYMQACRAYPCCTAWRGAGVASLQLQQLSEAEECLAEANVLNNRDAEVWAQLSLLCFLQKRYDEGEQALTQSLRLDFADIPLLQQMGSALLAAGKWTLAETTLRRAMAATAGDASTTAALLGDALGEQHRYEEAAEVYKIAAAGADADAAATATAKLKEIAAKTGK